MVAFSTVLGFEPLLKYGIFLVKQVKMFSIARVRTDRYRLELQRTESDIAFWQCLATKILGSLTDEQLREGLQNDLNDYIATAEEAREEIKGWCRRLSLKVPGTKEGAEDLSKSDDEDVEVAVLDNEGGGSPSNQTVLQVRKPVNKIHLRKHRLKNQERSLSIDGRTRFVVYGKTRIKFILGSLHEIEDKLFGKCAAAASLGHYVGVLEKLPVEAVAGTTAVMRFILEAKKRVQDQITINRIEPTVNEEGVLFCEYEYVAEPGCLDSNMSLSSMLDYSIRYGSLEPKEDVEGRFTMPHYSNCIIVPRGGSKDWKLTIHQASTIYRIFAEDPSPSRPRAYFSDPPDGDMLRCCAMFVDENEGVCDLLFKVPQGTSPPRTLRQLLLDTRCKTHSHPLAERTKFAIRLATAVLVVHSVGLVHKRINPECIVVLEPLPMNEEQVFPFKLGFPYITAFQAARTDGGYSDKATEIEAYRRRGIYCHPRDQGEERKDRYLVQDDIYSLGVCLFEVALWRSLFIWDKDVDDYVHDDSFIPLSNSLEELEHLDLYNKAVWKTGRLLEAAKTMIPPVLGTAFADVVVACLSAGYNTGPFADEVETMRRQDEGDVNLKFLELVLNKLRSIRGSAS